MSPRLAEFLLKTYDEKVTEVDLFIKDNGVEAYLSLLPEHLSRAARTLIVRAWGPKPSSPQQDYDKWLACKRQGKEELVDLYRASYLYLVALREGEAHGEGDTRPGVRTVRVRYSTR